MKAKSRYRAKHKLFVVTGAPGAGKTTTAEALLGIDHGFMVFDIDWLINEGSEFLGARIEETPLSWRPWAKLWFEVLHSAIRNHQQPIFFCPNTPDDFTEYGLPDWCEEVDWLLLDCADQDRVKRLRGRGWREDAVSDCVKDAEALRTYGFPVINTSNMEPDSVAAQVITWACKRREQESEQKT